jgi:flagellar motor protein MotB
VKFQYIAEYRGTLPRSHLCCLMGVTERGLHAWKHRPPSHRQRRDMVLLAHIRDQHRLSLGSYGRPRMTEELNELGIRVGQRRVGRLMRQNAARLDPDDMAGLDALREDIRERLGERLARQHALSGATRAAIGELVEGLGGQIDEHGVITFPDDILFAPGSATPTPALRNFLAQACPPWFEAMQRLEFDVREVRIEGHASSDWIGVSPDVAYFNNLNLSQQRAATVLRLCLENLGSGEAGRWARQRATAVGHSSSRPILDAAGQEDSHRSRRVVFSASATTDDIFTGIGSAISN